MKEPKPELKPCNFATMHEYVVAVDEQHPPKFNMSQTEIGLAKDYIKMGDMDNAIGLIQQKITGCNVKLADRPERMLSRKQCIAIVENMKAELNHVGELPEDIAAIIDKEFWNMI